MDKRLMNDGDLRAEGYIRNSKNGLMVKYSPSGCCAGGNAKMPIGEQAVNTVRGITNFTKYVINKKREVVNDAVRAERLAICSACTAVDSKGKRLFRKGIFEKLTCGEFFVRKPLRDPAKDGCGCLLEAKIRVPDEACPIGRWKAASAKEQIVKLKRGNMPDGFEPIAGIPNVGAAFSIPLTLLDGRRILLWVKKINKVYEGAGLVGAEAASIVEAFGQTLLVKERVDDINAAIAAWTPPEQIEPPTLETLEKEATNSGLRLERYAWPMAFFSLDDSTYRRTVPTNMRYVSDLPEFLASAKARLLEFKGRPATKGPKAHGKETGIPS